MKVLNFTYSKGLILLAALFTSGNVYSQAVWNGTGITGNANREGQTGVGIESFEGTFGVKGKEDFSLLDIISANGDKAFKNQIRFAEYAAPNGEHGGEKWLYRHRIIDDYGYRTLIIKPGLTDGTIEVTKPILNIDGNLGLGIPELDVDSNSNIRFRLQIADKNTDYYSSTVTPYVASTGFTGNEIVFNNVGNNDSYLDKEDEGNFSIRMGATNETVLKIFNNGSVGFGDNLSSPLAKFSFNDNGNRIYFSGPSMILSPDNGDFNFQANNSTDGINFSANDFGFLSGGVGATGNVGIGTISPSERLDIRGTDIYSTSYTKFTGKDFLLFGSDIGGAHLDSYIDKIDTEDLVFRMGNTPNQISALIIKNDGNIGIGTTTPTEKLEVDGNVLVTGEFITEEDVIVDGNVGIGTETPSEKLAVDGNITTTGDILGKRSDGFLAIKADGNVANSGNEIILHSPTSTIPGFQGDVAIYSSFTNASNSKGIRFGSLDESGAQNSYSENMVIQNDGKVGIGTSTPVGNLHVSSESSGDAILRIEADTGNSNEANNPILEFRQDGGNNGAYIGFDDQGSGTNPDNIFRVGVRYLGNNTDALIVKHDNTFVGIGTSSPFQKLDVSGNITVSNDIMGNRTSRTTSNTFGIYSETNSNDGSYIKLYPSNDNTKGGNISIVSNSSSAFTNTGNIQFSSYTGSSWKKNMTIKPDGFVGIGTETPSSRLDIVGQVKATSANILGNIETSNNILGNRTGVSNTSPLAIYSETGQTQGAYIKLHGNNSSSEGNVAIVANSSGPANTGEIKFYTTPDGSNYNTTMTIDKSGQVGIGGSPISGVLLNVNGQINGNSADINGVIKGVSADISGNLEAGSINVDGNITTSTGQISSNSLSVTNFISAGDISTSDLVVTSSLQLGTTTITNFDQIGGAFVKDSNDDIHYSTGDVYVGDYPNTERNLNVFGKIKTTEIRVTMDSNDWSDYVFADNYKLKSLAEVEKFIKRNKHLPDVPSAKSLEKTGLNLGEMQSTLLKKIEELTLYMIELKSENETLKNRVATLENTK